MPILFFSCFLISRPAAKFGMKSLMVSSSDIAMVIVAIIAIIVITVFVSPSCCSAISRVIVYIMYSSISAIASLIGLNPAFVSILFISASASIFLTILPASFAIISPTSIVMAVVDIIVSVVFIVCIVGISVVFWFACYKAFYTRR